MKIKEILSNPWTKRIGIATGVGITSIFVAKKVKANNDRKNMQYRIDKARNEKPSASSSTTENPATSSSYIDNTLDLRSYDGMQYNSNTIVLANKRMQFTMTGIRNMQKYMARANEKAGRQIAMSGGIDGIIGRGYIKAYKELISGMSLSQQVNTIKQLLKSAGKSEFKIIE